MTSFHKDLSDIEGRIRRHSFRTTQGASGGAVSLAARLPSVKVPSLSVDLRVADGGLNTAVERQGHGFQRALLIAIVQQLAAVNATRRENLAADENLTSQAPTRTALAQMAPALVLVLEEPELYQHPLQARHFAAMLASLASQEGAPVQVCYATHSEHFVDPAHYERLRRFRRRAGAPWPESQVTEAAVDRVVARLADVYKPEQIPLRVQMTLRRHVAEAVFAKAVVLVEGLRCRAAEWHRRPHWRLRRVGFAVVKGHNKRQLLIPWAILGELRLPCYVIFDADAGMAGRMRTTGRDLTQVDAAVIAARRENELVLRTLGLKPKSSRRLRSVPTTPCSPTRWRPNSRLGQGSWTPCNTSRTSRVTFGISQTMHTVTRPAPSPTNPRRSSARSSPVSRR